MRLLAQEEYGLRCLIHLARNPGPGRLTLSEVARAEGLTPEYAGKIMQELRRGGLIIGIRGPGGGYKLGRAAAEISVWDAIQVLGGPLFSDEFCMVHPGRETECVRSENCSLRALWRAVDGAVRRFLQRVTLADLVREENHMEDWLGRAGEAL
jgi:Rrf2 family protein